MYLAIDIGGTKTLLAVFDEAGAIVKKTKFPTSQDYQQFKNDLRTNIGGLGIEKFLSAAVGIPGLIDHKTGTSIDAGGNLPWKNVSVKEDLKEILNGISVFINNDAKLAGLSEALLAKDYKKVLYLTISTGIGGAVINNGRIDPDFENFEPGRMIFEDEDKVQNWERLASGKALVKQYGKLASEIEDPAIWQSYAPLVAMGIENLLATVQPDIVIIGGGVGAHLEKFEKPLDQELRRLHDPLVPIPPIIKARRAEEAVIYGCYEYIRQNR